MNQNLSDALKDIPDGLRLPLVQQFTDLLTSYRNGDWEKVGLKSGKICEIIYTILAGHVVGSFPIQPAKPSNMVSACTDLEKAGSSFSRSVRIQIPRMLIATYELRNNRAIGHVGGEVDPNHMDAEFFLRATKWLVAELIRVFECVSVEDARGLIESITERIFPLIWEGDGIKRVLNPNLNHRDQALALTYSCQNIVTARDLCNWAGYSNLSRYRKAIISVLHKEALLNFDETTDAVTLLPTGSKYVEESGILNLP